MSQFFGTVMSQSEMDARYAQLGAGLAGGQFVVYNFTTPALGLTLLNNSVDVTTTGFSGLLTTDRVLEVQPTSALPANVGIGYAYIPTNGSLTVRFSTPIALVSNATPSMRLTVFRTT